MYVFHQIIANNSIKQNRGIAHNSIRYGLSYKNFKKNARFRLALDCSLPQDREREFLYPVGDHVFFKAAGRFSLGTNILNKLNGKRLSAAWRSPI